jgi:serine/threonine protein kinase
MATGDRPFKGDTQMSVLSAIIKDAPASVSDLKPSLPRELARIIKHCLAKDPEDRYQTAKDLRNDLRSLRDDLASGERRRDDDFRQHDDPGARGRGVVNGVASRHPVMRPLPSGDLRSFLPRRSSRPPDSPWLAYSATRGGGASTSQAAGSPVPFASVSLTRLTTTGTAGLAALSADGRYAAVRRLEQPLVQLVAATGEHREQRASRTAGGSQLQRRDVSPDGQLHLLHPSIRPDRISRRSTRFRCWAAARGRFSRTSTVRPRSHLTASGLPSCVARQILGPRT